MEQRDINSRTRADTFGLRPDIYDALAGNMVKKTDLESLLPNYGAATAPKESKSVSNTWFPFTKPIEPMIGCRMFDGDGGGIVLDVVGMWECFTNIYAFNNGVLLGNAQAKLELWSPEGEFVERQTSKAILPGNSGFPMVTQRAFVVDRPGYVIRSYVKKDSSVNFSAFMEESFMSASYKYNGVFGGV